MRIRQICCQANMVFTGVERMGGQNRIQPNILYVGKLSEPQCRVFLENYRDVSAVVIRDSGGGYSPSMTRRSNIMELGRSVTPEEVIALSSRALEAEEREDASTLSFLGRILEAGSPYELLDKAALAFGVPLVAATPGGRQNYAYSRTVPSEDPAWALLTNKSNFTYELHTRYLLENYRRDVNSRDPYWIEEKESGRWRLQAKVFFGQSYLGNLATADIPYEQVAQVNPKLFRLLGSVLAQMIVLRGRTLEPEGNREADFRSALLADILDGVFRFDEYTEEKLRTEIMQCDCLRLLYLPLQDYDYRNNAQGQLKQELYEFFPNSLSFYYRRNVIILLDVRRDGGELERRAGEFEEVLRNNRIYAAVSDEMTSLRELPLQYAHLDRALSLHRAFGGENHLFYYDDYRFYDMALQCTDGDPASLRRYCLPVLHEIRAYDGTHNSELFKTLRQYVLTGKSMTRTVSLSRQDGDARGAVPAALFLFAL